MSLNSRRVYAGALTTGTADTLATASVVAGTALLTNIIAIGTLSAKLSLLAQTDTFTWTVKWQVSKDNSTWIDITVPQNPANVTYQTGTAGTEAAVARVIEAPLGIHGWAYCRVALVTGGTTGAAIDTYSISYCYVKAE